MSNRFFSIIAFGILLLLVAGCTRRDNPTVPEAPLAGQVSQGTHQYFGLSPDSSLWSQFPSRWIAIYTPPGYDFNTTGARFPVLYLLPGYDGEPSFYYRFGNENYYRTSAIAAVADELIASGEIKPMFIVMPDASIYYGGSFFNNNDSGRPMGKHDVLRAGKLYRRREPEPGPLHRQQRITRYRRPFFRWLRRGSNRDEVSRPV